jgi:hypothetical protein
MAAQKINLPMPFAFRNSCASVPAYRSRTIRHSRLLFAVAVLYFARFCVVGMREGWLQCPMPGKF